VPLPPADASWADEEAMDVEWAHAIAPAANIDVVEVNHTDADDNIDTDLLNGARIAGILPNVSVVSMSWHAIGPGGDDEDAQELSYDQYFTTPGVTYIVASGDDGGDLFGYPAASPNVIAVGGTSLKNLDAQGDYPGAGPDGEIGWSGSGGGVSQFEQHEPAYQLAVQRTGSRTVPDVAFDAYNDTGVCEYDSFGVDSNSLAWTVGNGTSLGTPCWAGLIAIVNQGRVAAGGSTLDSRSQTLPALYSLPPSDFHHDSGDFNNGTDDIGLLDQGRYDYVTGLGTPAADHLVHDLTVWQAVALSPASVPEGTVGVAHHQAVMASGGTGDKQVTFSIVPNDTIPDGLIFSTKANELDITGTPLVSGTVSFIVTATDQFGAYYSNNYTLIINPNNDVTNQLQVSASGLVYNRGTQFFGGTITLTNTGTTAIASTLEVVLTGLPSGVTLANASGTTADGNPYILVALPSDTLAPGQSINFTVMFSNPKKMSFQYGTSLFDV